MALNYDQLKHPKKRPPVVIAGVTVPTLSSFWTTGQAIEGSMTTATSGEEANEAGESSATEAGETSAPTTRAASAGGDASAGAAAPGM